MAETRSGVRFSKESGWHWGSVRDRAKVALSLLRWHAQQLNVPQQRRNQRRRSQSRRSLETRNPYINDEKKF
jgi:hypothetical protein